MADRAMEAKRMKMMRMRLAGPRQYQQVYFNEGKDKDPRDYELDKDKTVHPETVQYRKRAGRIIDEGFANTVSLGHKGTPPGRKEAWERQKELEASFPDGVNLRIQGPGPKNCFQVSYTYFNSRKDTFLVVHYDLRRGIIRRSITYGNMPLLRVKWEQDKIVWISTAPIPR